MPGTLRVVNLLSLECLLFLNASRQVSSGMQIFSDCWEGKPTRLVSDYYCFSSALPGCSANRYLNKHAHHAQSPPTVGQQNKQPQPCVPVITV